MASRSRNGGLHVSNSISPATLAADLTHGNRHARRRAKALVGRKTVETRPRRRKKHGVYSTK